MSIPVQKIGSEGPVPSEWRDAIRDLVACIASGEYKSEIMPRDVVPLENATIKQISGYLEDYGCSLINLPPETWESSIYVWQVKHWEVLVDLYTLEEGRSDLVLSLTVREDSGKLNYEVYMVYVP